MTTTSPLDRIHDCRKCILRRTASQVVVGEGKLTSKVMVVGEAPGRNEDDIGRPFVGRSGQYLFNALAYYGIKREWVYTTNIVKCRPPENRDPQAAEVEKCKPNLLLQLEVIKPLVIIPVGRFSLEFFVKGVKITHAHGELLSYKNFDLMPLLHPAYVLRNRSLENRFYGGVEAIKDRLLELANREKALFEPRRAE